MTTPHDPATCPACLERAELREETYEAMQARGRENRPAATPRENRPSSSPQENRPTETLDHDEHPEP